MTVVSVVARVAWTSTYTYILLLFVAAAFVAYIARPKGRGEVVKRLIAGKLIAPAELNDKEKPLSGPRLHVHCKDDAKVVFRRLGVDGLTESGADSLAVTFKGKDVDVLERVSPGYPNDPIMAGAEFVIDMTGHEWRHVKWMNEDSGLWCAFTLHVRKCIDFTVELKR